MHSPYRTVLLVAIEHDPRSDRAISILTTHKAHVRENRSVSAEVWRSIRRAVPFSSRFRSLVMAQRGVSYDEGRTG